MRLQNNILIFFYAIFFIIYFNINSVELKGITQSNVTGDNKVIEEVNFNNNTGDFSENTEDSALKDQKLDTDGLNILTIESDNKHDSILNNNEETSVNNEKDATESVSENEETKAETESLENEVNNEQENKETQESSEEELDELVDELEKEAETEYDEAATEELSEVEEESEVEGEENEVEGAESEVEGAESEVEGAESEVEGAESELEGEESELEGEESELEEEESELEGEESELEVEEESELEGEKENNEEDNNESKDYDKENSNKSEDRKNEVSWNKFNLFSIFKKPLLKKSDNNYFRRQIQNDFAFKNGLYFTATSAASYNRLVDNTKYASIPLKGNTLVFVVTANKFFFQDLIYSSNKYLAVKKKFAFLMNSIINNLKKSYYFKNFNYQYLFRDDSFARDNSNKVLDYALLGDLSKATQTIYFDDYKGRVSMHKLYGGWFHFLGIVVVHGYKYDIVDSLGSVEVVPYHLQNEFKKSLERKDGNYNSGYIIGLWRDFPNNKFSVWRYSVELFLWDVLNILPYQLPHPATFVLSYNERKKMDYKEHNENVEDYENETENIFNWHNTIKKYISSIKGLDVVLVSANDYLKRANPNKYDGYISSENVNKKNLGYIFLILLNKDFFSDDLVSAHDYQNEKKNRFFGYVKEVLEKLEDLLKKLKDALDKLDDDNEEPTVIYFNYLSEETNYNKINPHILGEVAGITKFIKCRNYLNSNCVKNVSLHYKYGGWFEFGGAIYVKNVNDIKVEYENHEIVEKKYEKLISQKANCATCLFSGLWRDLPGKDMSKYRYPLNVFVLERPELNIKDINLQDIHPFFLLNLLKKGIQVERQQIYAKNSNLEKNDENLEAYDNENVEGNDYENVEANVDEVVETNEEDEQFEEIENEDSENKFDDIKPKNSEEEEDSNNVVGSSDEEINLSGKYNSVENLEKEFNNSDNWFYNEFEDEDTYDKQELEKGENIEDLLLEDSYNDNEKQDNIVDNLDKVTHLYETYDNGNDLHNLNSDENSNGLYRKFLLFFIWFLVATFIAFIIGLGIKLYKKFMQKKILDKNKIVLAFKEKDEIPVVQGIPAPWLNT